MTRYGFRQALGGFFHADQQALQALLPPGLRPLEGHPGHGVLAVTAFDFTESEVGPYGELVVSVLVPPYAREGQPLPHAATFPVALFTTTAASRAHAAARWLLPAHERCLEIGFSAADGRRRVQARDRGAPVLDLEVARRGGSPCERIYQVFSQGGGRLHRVNLRISGALDEHQEETGALQLGPLLSPCAAALLDPAPLTEQSMDAGEQRFDALQLHGSHRGEEG